MKRGRRSKGCGVEPLMLLTSCPAEKNRKEGIWRIVESYPVNSKLTREKYLFYKDDLILTERRSHGGGKDNDL